MLTRKKLGTHGEKKFAGMCAKNGVTCTVPDEDINGWDYYLEFPEVDISSNFDGIHKSCLQCKVQVKSTYKKNGNRQIPLSTLKVLVTDGLPPFIVFLEFNSKDKLKKLFVTHVSKDISYRVLKKAKEIELNGEQKSKPKITIGLSERHELTKPFAENLLKYFTAEIGEIEEYKMTRIKMLASLGYEDGHFEGQMIMPNLDTALEESLIAKSWIPIESFSMTDMRFGLPGKKIGDEEGVLMISGIKEQLKGEIAFVRGPLLQPLLMDATLETCPYGRHAHIVLLDAL